MHKNNPHSGRYDFDKLISALPELEQYVHINKHDSRTIDFHNPDAVKSLNRALLKVFYQIDYWDIPKGYLCPPIPGRAEYIHQITQLIQSPKGFIPKGEKTKILDIGIGANCIYPLIGHQAFGWSFVGSEVDKKAISSSNTIISKNKLGDHIEIRQQTSSDDILTGIIESGEFYDMMICNPPFHSSAAEANKANRRKVNNLKKTKGQNTNLNFGGQSNELWCPGGEVQFVSSLIDESRQYKTAVYWYTSLISKETNLIPLQRLLKSYNVEDVRILEFSLGNKKSRILAWTFLKEKQRKAWEHVAWAK